MRGQIEGALKQAGAVPPRWYSMLLNRGEMSLDRLLKEGVTVPAKAGNQKVQVTFEKLGEPFKARDNTSWMAQRVKSSFGGVSTLLLEDGLVSGLLKLQR